MTTAIGPLEKSILNANNNEIGGRIAPTIIDIKNTLITLFPIIIPIVEGIIRYAKVNTSPTNLVIKRYTYSNDEIKKQ